MYTKAKILTTSFGKSVRYEVLSSACFTVKKRVRYSAGSYAVVSPLVSLTIVRFIRLCECCFVIALLQLCTYTTFEYPVCIFFHVDKLRKHYNFTEL